MRQIGDLLALLAHGCSAGHRHGYSCAAPYSRLVILEPLRLIVPTADKGRIVQVCMRDRALVLMIVKSKMTATRLRRAICDR